MQNILFFLAFQAFLFFIFYSYLKASIGFKLAARLAG
jgi:hypothetical protein